MGAATAWPQARTHPIGRSARMHGRHPLTDRRSLRPRIGSGCILPYPGRAARPEKTCRSRNFQAAAGRGRTPLTVDIGAWCFPCRHLAPRTPAAATAVQSPDPDRYTGREDLSSAHGESCASRLGARCSLPSRRPDWAWWRYRRCRSHSPFSLMVALVTFPFASVTVTSVVPSLYDVTE